MEGPQTLRRRRRTALTLSSLNLPCPPLPTTLPSPSSPPVFVAYAVVTADGAVLYTGTLFAPIEDRDAPGKGFTHKVGDIVTVATPKLGRLVNRMKHTDQCPPWIFGTSHLMRNLARRGLL